MPKITELYAWVCIEDDGREGVPAYNTRLGVMPLMGADRARAESLKPFAQDTAKLTGRPVKLVRSTSIEVIDVVKP